jgi:hypothetical protein
MLVPGEALDGVNLFYGVDVAELAKTHDFVSLLGYPARGTPFDPEETRLFNRVGICCLAADARIWIPKIAALVGANAPYTAALAAAYSGQIGATIGIGKGPGAAKMLSRFLSSGVSTLDQMVTALRLELQNGFIEGLGVPFRQKDERLVAAMTCFRDLRPDSRVLACVDLLQVAAEQIGASANVMLAVAALVNELQIANEMAGSIVGSAFLHFALVGCASEALRGNLAPGRPVLTYSGPPRRGLL